mmetsp:Transcript_48518/g.154961  ORF Transcript_48518/g.154961 Transcript_48518/m.154961 type:complete len:236 (-) Transcript_48518:455-1162(-)
MQRLWLHESLSAPHGTPGWLPVAGSMRRCAGQRRWTARPRPRQRRLWRRASLRRWRGRPSQYHSRGRAVRSLQWTRWPWMQQPRGQHAQGRRQRLVSWGGHPGRMPHPPSAAGPHDPARCVSLLPNRRAKAAALRSHAQEAEGPSSSARAPPNRGPPPVAAAALAPPASRRRCAQPHRSCRGRCPRQTSRSRGSSSRAAPCRSGWREESLLLLGPRHHCWPAHWWHKRRGPATVP